MDKPDQDAVDMSLARAGVHIHAFIQPRRGKAKALGGFANCLNNQAMTAAAHDPGVDVLRGLSPIELEKDRAAVVDRDFPERLPVKQILAHDPKGFLNPGSIKRLSLVHERSLL